uniref:Uncharacterized protein n=1 Tax=Oryza brachyantha TaxID=4533 RepID=J3MQW4_ORYBR
EGVSWKNLFFFTEGVSWEKSIVRACQTTSEPTLRGVTQVGTILYSRRMLPIRGAILAVNHALAQKVIGLINQA